MTDQVDNTELIEMLDRIKILIKHKGLNQLEFFEWLGYQKHNMTNWMHKKNTPPYHFIQRIAEKMPEVSIQWVLTGRGDFLNGTNAADVDIDYDNNKELRIRLRHLEKEIALKDELLQQMRERLKGSSASNVK